MLNFLSAYSGTQLIIVLIAYALAILCAIIPHEVAHGLMAQRCGDDTARLAGRLTLNPAKHLDFLGTICLVLVGFGWAKPVPVNPNNFKERKKGLFLVSISGVVTNLAIAFFAIGFYCLISLIPTTVYEIEILAYLLLFIKIFLLYTSIINLSLMIFNLFPIYPLDGFNLVASLSKNSSKFIYHMQRYALVYSIVLIMFCNLFISPFVSFLSDGFLNFWSIVFYGY